MSKIPFFIPSFNEIEFIVVCVFSSQMKVNKINEFIKYFSFEILKLM